MEKVINQYTYEVLTGEDKELFEDAVDCLNDAFMGIQVGEAFIREPMAGMSSIKKEDFRGFVQMYLESIVSQGFVFIAKDKETGRVVAALASEDFDPNGEVPVFEGGLEHMNNVVDRLNALDEKFFEVIENKTGKPIEAGEYLNGFLVGARTERNKKHITGKLMEMWIEKAEEKGYKGLFVEATNKRSQKLAREMFGFYMPNDLEGNPIELIYKEDEVFNFIPEDFTRSCQLMYYPIKEEYRY